MSKYTTEVRWICETLADMNEIRDPSPGWIIEHSKDKIFDFNFPIFDEAYRPVLETKILKRYYTREICCETVGRWKLFLEQRLNEIMPYYNKLYESELIEFNPFYDVNLTIDHKTENEGTEVGSGTRNTGTEGSENIDTTRDTDTEGSETIDETNWEYYSDTPQGTVGNIDNLTYLTNATKNTKDSTREYEQAVDETINRDRSYEEAVDEATTSNKTVNSTEDYLEHIVGKRGGQTYAKMLKEWRDTFLNIDMMVLDDLQDLFFNLW